ncbi:hypothetical protein DEU38_103135 [Rhodococcus sp. AG1013]|uniref:hypothetical protein n=1 Tax=Rhodococcus sp. AG1013 TaxID=2183996 RepID=UPI000E0BBE10|nr:hypothetical protein [Rhodococcus sp. AG1013]RDI32402.1 hypothetical protein DEU38_103135 [Rhodococcus sp. AG1013]
MTAVEQFEVELAEKRPALSLLERVQLRQQIDELSGVVYKPVSPAQMQRVARITERELTRIIRNN